MRAFEQQGHGANRVKGNVKKRGENKGILAARRDRKRHEAETRNARTPLERTRAYRLLQKEEES